MFWRRKSRIGTVEEHLLDGIHRVGVLEERLDRVAIRQCVSEVMLATTVGFVLRSLDESLLRQLVDELRKSITASASSEVVALEMEERAAQLLDQIEHLARLPGSAQVGGRMH